MENFKGLKMNITMFIPVTNAKPNYEHKLYPNSKFKFNSPKKDT